LCNSDSKKPTSKPNLTAAQVAANAHRVYDELTREEEAFTATLAKGQKLLDDLLGAAAAKGGGAVSGADAFLLYDSYGFPVELTQELAEARDIQVGWKWLGGGLGVWGGVW
jgi:alanyl-tRNA synthetase